ncbi:hypothetical protein RZS08_62180, partial [Arthrospira platensis SPKY1]|nr:hypothetical protein [Arthrospira platensis SPKY1]
MTKFSWPIRACLLPCPGRLCRALSYFFNKAQKAFIVSSRLLCTKGSVAQRGKVGVSLVIT